MAISQRLRYEILRRDGFRCRYCGLAPSESELHIDHVIPEVLGGQTEPSNLVAACLECNQGKASSSPSESSVADVAQAAMIWRDVIRRAADEFRLERTGVDRDCAEFDTVWRQWHPVSDEARDIPRSEDWEQSIKRYLRSGLEIDDLIEFIPLAMQSQANVERKWSYFCGIAWSHVKDIQKRALELVAEEA